MSDLTPEDRRPVLEIEHIAKSYSGTPVLTDVNLVAASGELTVIYGLPASGKSVLVRLLTGLETPDSGRIILRGQDVTHEPAAERNIGYVPQSFALYPHLSVRSNIAYPLDLAGVPAAESRAVVENAATMLGITEHLNKRPDQLSGGQKQRVAIARGIAKRTDFFILDDPLAGLDFKLREQLVDDLRELKHTTGASILYVTSDVIEALTLADTLAVLSAGTIVEAGVPQHLYREPRNLRTMGLVGFPAANFLRGTLQRRDGEVWCTTPLFDFRAELLQGGENVLEVLVGLRPEHIHLSHRVLETDGSQGQALIFPATVLLREDLGGEDIVYLQAEGITLTMVDRDHYRGDDLDADVTLSVHPGRLALFAVSSGELLGRGTRATDLVVPALGAAHG
jgi:ABC-type sugar transport system ATPase subunit